jgi:hypothetical protein
VLWCVQGPKEIGDVDTDDEKDEEAQYEQWKSRELARIRSAFQLPILSFSFPYYKESPLHAAGKQECAHSADPAMERDIHIALSGKIYLARAARKLDECI